MKNSQTENGGQSTIQLKGVWSFWVRYQTSYIQTRNSYLDSNVKVYDCNTLQQLAALWKHTSFSKPSELFYNFSKNRLRKVEVGDEEKVIECLMLFRAGVEPKWEDPANESGGSFIVELKDLPAQDIDTVWQTLVFQLLGNSFPYSDLVTGFRLLDRMKKHNLLKLELWTKVGLAKHKKESKEYNHNKELKEQVTEALHKVLTKIQSLQALSVHSIILKDHHTTNKAQLFVNCLGETKCVNFEKGEDFNTLQCRLQEQLQIDSELQFFGASRAIENNEELDEQFDGITLTAQIALLGGKGKKKKKNYSTPKRIKHKHSSTKLHTLSYYAVGKDGSVQRVKKFCEQESCREKGVFMAAHWNRYYCGKCGLTLIKTDAPAEEPKKKAKKQ